MFLMNISHYVYPVTNKFKGIFPPNSQSLPLCEYFSVKILSFSFSCLFKTINFFFPLSLNVMAKNYFLVVYRGELSSSVHLMSLHFTVCAS